MGSQIAYQLLPIQVRSYCKDSLLNPPASKFNITYVLCYFLRFIAWRVYDFFVWQLSDKIYDYKLSFEFEQLTLWLIIVLK